MRCLWIMFVTAVCFLFILGAVQHFVHVAVPFPFQPLFYQFPVLFPLLYLWFPEPVYKSDKWSGCSLKNFREILKAICTGLFQMRSTWQYVTDALWYWKPSRAPVRRIFPPDWKPIHTRHMQTVLHVLSTLLFKYQIFKLYKMAVAWNGRC